ncbi:MAG: glucose-6-phosphate dehydrogenase assembly protein OpcA [Candidatus Eremiobacteraeota bacterium]|nr:glucose-6-phosphate dehydrogenase assembly protein OpcA [Candidatus Eremiobacteraeota bacterium]
MTLDVNALLGELSRERQAGVSTTTLNLIGFVDDPELLEWLHKRTDKISDKYPSRSILLDACHDESLHEIRSARRNPDDETATIRAEQLVIGVRGINAIELRSIVHALTVPNVPTMLVWTGKQLAADERFEQLVDIATSIIVDSSRFESTNAGLHDLVQFIGAGERVQDLAYMRLRPWQDAVAEFFDDEELTAQLPRIERVQIASGSAAEGYYFMGWLASRLGWKPCDTHKFCNIEGNNIDVKFEREGQVRRVQRVQLETGKTTFCAEIQAEGAGVICATICGALNRPKRCLPIPTLDMVSLVEQAILLPQSDDVFRDSLAMAREVLQLEDRSA